MTTYTDNHHVGYYCKLSTVSLVSFSEVRSCIFPFICHQNNLVNNLLLLPHCFQRTADACTTACIDVLEGTLPIGQLLAFCCHRVRNSIERIDKQFCLSDTRD